MNGVESNARRVSLFLNPAGTALTLLGEDEDRNIPLDMLEMQFYREIVANSRLRDLLRHPNQTRTGLTCRDISAEISQENLAIHSGMGSRAFRLFASGSASQIRTWQFGEHSDYTLVMDLVPAAISCELIQGWTVSWDAILVDKLMQLRSRCLPKETGGILIGSYDQGRRVIYIVDALPSPIDSQESRSSYIRGTRRLNLDPPPPRPSLRPGPTCAVGADHSNSLAGAPLAPDASYLSPDSIHAPNSPGTATTPSSCLLASWRGRRASAWLLWQIQFCARLCSIRLTLPVPRSRRYGPRNQGRSASRPGTHLC